MLSKDNRFIPKTYIYTKEKYKHFNISQSNLETLINKNVIKIHHFEGGVAKYVDTLEIQKYVEWERRFAEEHLTDYEIWSYLGKELKDSIEAASHRKHLEVLVKMNKVRKVKLDFPLISMDKKYETLTNFYNKKDAVLFLKEYLNTQDASKLLNINALAHATNELRKIGIEEIRIVKKHKFTFYKKSDILDYLHKQKDVKQIIKNKVLQNSSEILALNNTVNKTHVKNLFRVVEKTLQVMINKGHLKAIGNRSRQVLFSSKEVKELLETRDVLHKKYYEEYLTANEIKEIHGINIHNTTNNVTIINVPEFLWGIDRYKKNKILYKKKDVLKIVKERKEKFNNSVDVGTIYENVLYRMKINNIKFQPNSVKTEELWLSYIKKKQFKDNNEGTKRTTITSLLNATVVMAERLINKEIYECPSSELNFMFFNSNTSTTVKNWIYRFLKEIHDSMKVLGKTSFELSKIKKINTKKKIKTKEVYSTKEYKDLFQFVRKIALHKSKAIESIKKVVNAFSLGKNLKQAYDRYDSTWLYIILHLNNAWRHWDCTDIPRISFEGTSIQAELEWLEKNDISIEDAKKLIKRLQIKTFKHSKTGKERYLYISENLTLPFATALVLCEVRTRLINDKSETIIDFMTPNRKLPMERLKNSFFKGYNTDFKFGSMKMNRTFISLAFNIARNFIGTAHESDLLRFLRNHADFDTTNIYIHLSQEEIDFLCGQIFSRENFGIISDTIAELLFGETKDIEKRTKQINKINQKLGDNFKLEGIVNFLVYVYENEMAVYEIIKELDKEEIQQKYFELLTGHLPSKIKHIQCLLGGENCPYTGKECEGCHFAIYNFYALNTIADRLWQRISEIVSNFPKLNKTADKERMAILFIKDLKILKEAENKFGDIVYEFFDISKEQWDTLLINLPNIHLHLPKTNEVK